MGPSRGNASEVKLLLVFLQQRVHHLHDYGFGVSLVIGNRGREAHNPRGGIGGGGVFRLGDQGVLQGGGSGGGRSGIHCLLVGTFLPLG